MKLLPVLCCFALLLPALLSAAEREASPKGDATPAEFDQDKILAAARAADYEYQRGLKLLLEDLKSADEPVRIAAMTSLGRHLEPDAVPQLLPFLDANSHSADEVKAAVLALANIGSQAAVGGIQKLMISKDESLRTAAMNGLTRLNAIGAGDYVGRVNDSSGALRASADTNLGTLAHADAAKLLLTAMAHDHRSHIRRMCAIGLGKLGSREFGPALCDALSDSDPGVRRYAAESLVQIKYTPAILPLLMALESNVAGKYLNRCMMQLSGQDFGYDYQASQLERMNAIEKGYEWWAKNANSLR